MSECGKARFCIIGGDSAIGAALTKSLRSSGFEALSSSRRELIGSATQFHLDLLSDLDDFYIPECDVIVLAASMTGLAQCRLAPEAARQVNLDAQVTLARQASQQGDLRRISVHECRL